MDEEHRPGCFAAFFLRFLFPPSLLTVLHHRAYGSGGRRVEEV